LQLPELIVPDIPREITKYIVYISYFIIGEISIRFAVFLRNDDSDAL
jgi:hypothetical protein